MTRLPGSSKALMRRAGARLTRPLLRAADNLHREQFVTERSGRS